MTPDPGPVPAPLDLRERVDDAHSRLRQYPPTHMADVKAILDDLFAEVEQLRAERAALDATPPWEDPHTERPRLLAENAHLAAEYEALKAEAQEEISDLHRSYGGDIKRLRRKLKRAKAERDELDAKADAYPTEVHAAERVRDKAWADAERLTRERDSTILELGMVRGALKVCHAERVQARAAAEMARQALAAAAPAEVTLGPVGTVMLAEAEQAEGPHRYLSTGCYHQLCDDPRPDGTAACRLTCKWCDARCACSCHLGTDG